MQIRYIPERRLVKALFFDPTNASKVKRAYGVQENIVGEQLRTAIFELLGQRPQDPILSTFSNDEVFERAVKAIGSNSRPWAAFFRRYDELRKDLFDFNVSKVVVHYGSDAPISNLAKLKTYFPGQTCSRDTEAVVAFAKSLSTKPMYYERLRAAHRHFAATIGPMETRFREASIAACTALLIGRLGYQARAESWLSLTYKVAGMGFAPATEFLRNLGWTGFKPDRHVISMLEKWYTNEEEEKLIGHEIENIKRGFGSIAIEDERLVRKAILGAKTTPPDMEVNQADQLIWLYRSILGKSAL